MLYRDYEVREIRLPEERLNHIYTTHSYMKGMEWTIEGTLKDLDILTRSTSDSASVRIYYRWFHASLVGDKYVCVVVKTLESDAFIMTAYVATHIRDGEEIWRKE